RVVSLSVVVFFNFRKGAFEAFCLVLLDVDGFNLSQSLDIRVTDLKKAAGERLEHPAVPATRAVTTIGPQECEIATQDSVETIIGWRVAVQRQLPIELLECLLRLLARGAHGEPLAVRAGAVRQFPHDGTAHEAALVDRSHGLPSEFLAH